MLSVIQFFIQQVQFLIPQIISDSSKYLEISEIKLEISAIPQ